MNNLESARLGHLLDGVTYGETLYRNPLAGDRDVVDFRLEGTAEISFPAGRLRMTSRLDPEREGQRANFVLWCPVDFPADVAISWDFYPVREPGLCILFFAATARSDRDIFGASVSCRNGEYHQYHHGDINALHISYFRRNAPSERAFQTCNLRKSYGFHLVARGADPLPSVEDAVPPYHMRLVKCGPKVAFAINDLPVLEWLDDGRYGPVAGGGKIGFRQMAPLVAEYANLTVTSVERRSKPLLNKAH